MGSAGASDVPLQRQTRQQSSNRRISAILAQQEGVIGRRQLLESGIGEEAIRYRVAAGSLSQVFPGAFAIGLPLSVSGMRIAALLSTAPSFISHRDAGEHHGLLREIPGPVHVTVGRNRNLRRRGIIVHRTSHLHPEERRVCGVFRVTSPARTLVDLAGLLTERGLTRAYDECQRLGRDSPEAITRSCERSGGRPGTGVLIDLAREAPLAMSETRSINEGRFLRFCRDRGWPIPAVNVPVLGYEVDFLWTAQRLIVEMDSGFHDNPRSRAADARRDARLTAAGFHVYRLRERRLTAEPDEVDGELSSLLGERGVG
jgi:hypothetical protein